MLLRSKKTQGEDQNWCVILSPIASELDRKKVAQKIANVFSLSFDESQDLVRNTPIIILDNLSRPIAVKLKEYFRASGAETILTNDVFQKRKCYRTVWPEPPNLGFLHEWNPLEENKQENEQPLNPEDALHEIRSLSSEEKRPSMPQPSLTSIPFMNRSERDQMAEESDRWRKECLKLRDEIRELREQIENTKKDSLLSEFPAPQSEWYEEKEKDLKEAQILLEHANEKYELLRQEYANARQLYEEKITMLLQDSDQVKLKSTEFQSLLESLERENKNLKTNLLDKERGLQVFMEEALKEKDNFQQKLTLMSQEVEQLQRKMNESEAASEILLREKKVLEDKLSEQYREFLSLTEESRKIKAAYEERMLKSREESTRFEFQNRDFISRIEILQKSKEELELTLNRQSEQILHWKENYEQLLPKFLQMEKELSTEKSLRLAYEARQLDLEKTNSQLQQELDFKTLSVRQWELKLLDAEKQSQEFKSLQENQVRTLQQQTRLLEIREKELENARREILEIQAQRELQESVQRKTQLANSLLEKESLLKKLVNDQEKMETEIREREESIRSLLSQQELVEKEIIEAKQAQRHLADLAFRDAKSRKFGVNTPEESSAENSYDRA